MKTIKQLREEYDSKALSQMPQASDKLMLEVSDPLKKLRAVPTPAEMPAMLLFRRIAYRMYPNKQTVALYYSKAVDKYLSVPFGPDGNLNLSESAVYDTLEELEITEGAKWDAVKGGVSGAINGAIRGGAIGGVVAPGPGTAIGAVVGGVRGAYKGTKRALEKAKSGEVKECSDDITRASFKNKVNSLREERLEEWAPVARAVGGWLLNKALSWATGDDKKDNEAPKNPKDSAYNPNSNSDYIRQKSATKAKSSWQGARTTDDTYHARLKSATMKDIQSSPQPQRQVNENKISDLRKMITEGRDSIDMSINGRQVSLNTSMAKRIIEVHDSVNASNKKIVESMMNSDLESFKKLLNFSIKV